MDVSGISTYSALTAAQTTATQTTAADDTEKAESAKSAEAVDKTESTDKEDTSKTDSVEISDKKKNPTTSGTYTKTQASKGMSSETYQNIIQAQASSHVNMLMGMLGMSSSSSSMANVISGSLSSSLMSSMQGSYQKELSSMEQQIESLKNQAAKLEGSSSSSATDS